MTSVNVAIIHGIGVNKPGYSKELRKGIEKEFTNAIREILNNSDDYKEQINFKEIVWDDILGANQEKLNVILERILKQKKRKTFLGFWTSAGIIFVILFLRTIFKQSVIAIVFLLIAIYLLYHFGTKFYYQLRTGFASKFVMDIIGYLNKEAKDKIQERIKDNLKEVGAETKPTTFIAHSLGTVIASDFIWDRQEKKDFGDFSLSNFFTMGSPIALFALRYGAELFNKPIHIDESEGSWVNILDKDDPIAYPLKALNKEYNEVILKDTEVNVGIIGIAHIKYWADKKVHTLIAKKLAIDWLRINNKLAPDKITQLYRDYRSDS